MNPRLATNLIRAAGIPADLCLARDALRLAEKLGVQCAG